MPEEARWRKNVEKDRERWSDLYGDGGEKSRVSQDAACYNPLAITVHMRRDGKVGKWRDETPASLNNDGLTGEDIAEAPRTPIR